MAVRLMSAAGLVFKGSGFYITDYGKDGKKDQTKADTGKKKPDESGSAAGTSETKPASGESKSGSAESKPAAAESKPAAPAKKTE